MVAAPEREAERGSNARAEQGRPLTIGHCDRLGTQWQASCQWHPALPAPLSGARLRVGTADPGLGSHRPGLDSIVRSADFELCGTRRKRGMESGVLGGIMTGHDCNVMRGSGARFADPQTIGR